MSEKTFTVVGTAVNPNGTTKVRWANDLVARIKILDKAGCEEIDLIELPEPMTKLAAAEYFLETRDNLKANQVEILENKIAEKTKAAERAAKADALTQNVETRIETGADTDPRVEAFIEENS